MYFYFIKNGYEGQSKSLNGRVSFEIQPKTNFSAWVLTYRFFQLSFERNS